MELADYLRQVLGAAPGLARSGDPALDGPDPGPVANWDDDADMSMEPDNDSDDMRIPIETGPRFDPNVKPVVPMPGAFTDRDAYMERNLPEERAGDEAYMADLLSQWRARGGR